MKRCPSCGRWVPAERTKCRHCFAALDFRTERRPSAVERMPVPPDPLAKGRAVLARLGPVGIAGVVLGVLAILLGALQDGSVPLMGVGCLVVVGAFAWALRGRPRRR